MLFATGKVVPFQDPLDTLVDAGLAVHRGGRGLFGEDGWADRGPLLLGGAGQKFVITAGRGGAFGRRLGCLFASPFEHDRSAERVQRRNCVVGGRLPGRLVLGERVCLLEKRRQSFIKMTFI